MKTVLFFPPLYSQDKPIPLDVPDDAAAVLVDAGVVQYAPAPVTYDSALPVVIAPVVPSKPVFVDAPSIDGTPRIGQTLTGMDGTITGGTVVSRRWLLGAAVVSTAQTFLPTAAGALVYEVTATGPGGTTVAASAAVTVAPPAGALKRLGPVGQNLAIDDVSADGFGFPVLNRALLSYGWSSGGNPLPASQVDKNGFPIAIGAGGYNEDLFNVEGTLGPDGVPQVYVIESTCNVVPFANEIANGIFLSDTTTNGVRRVEFTPAPPAGRPQSVRIFMHGPLHPGTDFYRIFRKDEEAEVRAAIATGKVFRKQFVDRVKGYGVFRMMDWSCVNTTSGGQVEFAEYNPKDATSWTKQVPLEHQVGICNEADVAGWFNIPHAASDDFVRRFVGYIEANLSPHLQYTLEVSNEVWLPDGGRKQYSHFSNPGWPQLPGDPAWGAYGYRTAQIMAIAHKASGYAKRCRPYFGSQGENTAVTEGVLAGIRAAIAEWSDPTATVQMRNGIANSLGYVPEFAARFKKAGAVFAGFGGAIYLGAGMGRPGWDDAGKAKYRAWAATSANDDSGLAAFFDQLRTGSQMLDPNHYNLKDWVNTYAGQHTIAVREQIEMWAYEGCICVEDFSGELNEPGFREFRTRAMHDPRMVQLTRDWLTQCVAAGYTLLVNLCDISGPGGAYGSVESAYNLNFPRHIGLLEVQADPPTPSPLAIKLTTSGETKVTKSPTTAIEVTGGAGALDITVNGLVPGRTFDGFRFIDGAFTEATSQPVGATITVTDATGASVTATLVQDVRAAPSGVPASRYYRFTIAQSIYQDRIGSAELRFNDAAGPLDPTGWTASASLGSGGNGPDRLVDGKTDSSFITDGNGAGCVIVIDTKAARKPASVDVFACAEVGGFSFQGVLVEASVDQQKWTTIANRPVSAGSVYGGSYNIPLDFSGTVE